MRIISLMLCLAPFCLHADGKEASIQELAQQYLDHPTMMSQGCAYPIEAPCGNCDACPYYCEPPNFMPPDAVFPCCPEQMMGPPQQQMGPPQQQMGMPQQQMGPPQQQQQQQQPQAAQEEQTETQIPARIPLIQAESPTFKKPNCGPQQDGYTVNFEDVSVIQLIKFISRISGVNYIYDSSDLINLKITLVSEDPTQVADLSASLLQILNMHGLNVVEQGNNVLIYRNQNLSKISTVITEDTVDNSCDNAIITRVFQLYNVDAAKTAEIVRKLVSPSAIVDASLETRHLIVTDITANVNKIADLLSALDTPTMQVDVQEYQVQNADPFALAEYANEILNPIAGSNPVKFTPEPASRKVFIMGTPVLINRALQILASLDVPEIATLNPLPPGLEMENNIFFVYKLKHMFGADIAEALHAIGTNLQFTGVGNIEFVNAIYAAQWLDVNNSIIVTGSKDAVSKVVALLDILDEIPKQVYIEVLVLDTELTNSLDFGVQWIATGSEQNKLAFATGLIANPGSPSNLQNTAIAAAPVPPVNTLTGVQTTTPNPANITLPIPAALIGSPLIPSGATEAFGLGIVGNIITHGGRSFLTLGALLSALDEQGDNKVVINPKIMVEDGQPANFFVGQNIPYQTTSTVIQQTGSVTQNIQYEDIGVQLQVTPTIAPNNMVTLQINQTVADIDGIPTLTPITNKQLVTTRVHVPDGAFLVMSGHTRDQCVYIHSGIPCLGTLPLIGPTFSRNIEQRIKRNLVFFIRPKVVTNIEEGIILTNEEGYDYNYGSNPCSLIECGCECAPECEVYPNPCWPPSYPAMPWDGCPLPQQGQSRPAPAQGQGPGPGGPSPQQQSYPANPSPYYPSQGAYPGPYGQMDGAYQQDPYAHPGMYPDPYGHPGEPPPYYPGPNYDPLAPEGYHDAPYGLPNTYQDENYGPYPPKYSASPWGEQQPGHQMNAQYPDSALGYPYTINPLYPNNYSPEAIPPEGVGEFRQAQSQAGPNYIQTSPGFTQPNSARAATQPPYHSVYPSSGMPGTYPEYSDY